MKTCTNCGPGWNHDTSECGSVLALRRWHSHVEDCDSCPIAFDDLWRVTDFDRMCLAGRALFGETFGIDKDGRVITL